MGKKIKKEAGSQEWSASFKKGERRNIFETVKLQIIQHLPDICH